MTEVEFLEFVVRVAAEVYHQSYAVGPDDDGDGDDVVPRGRLAAVSGD